MSKDMRDQHGLSSGLLWTKDGEAKMILVADDVHREMGGNGVFHISGLNY